MPNVATNREIAMGIIEDANTHAAEHGLTEATWELIRDRIIAALDVKDTVRKYNEQN